MTFDFKRQGNAMTNIIKPNDHTEFYAGRLITVTQTSYGRVMITTACIDTEKRLEVRGRLPSVSSVTTALKRIIDRT